MKPLRCLLTSFALGVLATPMAVSGQSPAYAQDGQTSLTPHCLTLDAQPSAMVSPSLLVAPAVSEIAEPTLLLPQARMRNRRGIPLMVAGGALFVAGAIVGDDAGTILMLGGAGIGAWGLYVYFGG